MSQDLWYYSRDGEEKMGPTPGTHLRSWIVSGHLNGEHLVWRPGLADWTPIRQVPELQSAGPGASTPPSPGNRSLSVALSWLRDASLAWIQGVSTGRNMRTPARPGRLASFMRSVVSKVRWKLLLVGFLATVIVVKVVYIPAAASRAVSAVAERYGVDLTVQRWSAKLHDLSASAQHAVIQIPGPYAEKEFLRAEEIEVDLSLLGGLLDGQLVKEIRIKRPKIYLERLLAGRWNWEDVISRPVVPPMSDVVTASNSGTVDKKAQGAFSLPSLSVEGMSLQWVENLPGDSKSGIIQELRATLYVDDLSVLAKDLRGLVDPSNQPNSLLRLEARTGSGKISFNGRANFFSWLPSASQPATPDWMPMLQGKVFLENVGSNAFARLVPDAAIVPEGGSMTGSIDFNLARREVDCQASLNIQNATFEANQASRFLPADSSAVAAQLAGYRANGQYHFSCGGRIGDGTYRPFQAFQTNVVRQGVSQAPTTVRALAAVEHRRYSQEPMDPRLEDETDEILGRVDAEWLKWAGFAIRVDSTLRRSGLRPGRLPRLPGFRG